MFENEFETIASDIGSQTIVVRRANIRFAPTLVSDIGWISITTIYPKTYDRLVMGTGVAQNLAQSNHTANRKQFGVYLKKHPLIKRIIADDAY
jgi:hypothetical protein